METKISFNSTTFIVRIHKMVLKTASLFATPVLDRDALLHVISKGKMQKVKK